MQRMYYQGVVGAKPSSMEKIYKEFSKSLHSFIILPLLLSNFSGGIDLSAVSDKIRSGVDLEQNEEEVLLQDKLIRAAKIDAYFAKWDLPASGYGLAMVEAADKYGLDWRLIPALAKLETTGGKNVCKNPKGKNNWFGWGSCKISFNSVEESFDVIARNLSGNNPRTEKFYKDKTIDEILISYNPPATPGITPGYHKLAFKIMDEIDNIEVDQSTIKNNFLVMK